MQVGLNTDVLSGLDFEFEQPCEHGGHNSEAPAMFLVKRLINHCRRPGEYFCCLPCWERMGRANKIICGGCKAPIASSRDECLNIIRVIGSA